MKEFIFVFGSSDGEVISNSHFGDSDNFYIYKLKENGEFEFLRDIKNIIKDMEHGLPNKMKEVLKLIGNDIDILLVRQVSINFSNIAKKTKYQPILVNVDNKEDLFILLKEKFKFCMEMFEKRKSGEREEIIPEF